MEGISSGSIMFSKKRHNSLLPLTYLFIVFQDAAESIGVLGNTHCSISYETTLNRDWKSGLK